MQIFKLSDNNPDFIVEYYAAPENYKYNCKQIDIQDLYIIRDVGVIWTSAFKTKVLKDNKVYFDEKIWHGEDSLFVLDFFIDVALLFLRMNMVIFMKKDMRKV